MRRRRAFSGNPEISDEIIGFHAQQAVEKWLKAVMANLGLPQQRTHDIDQLGRVLEEHGVQLPVPRPRLAELTDFAVPLRYEDLLNAEPLDRRATMPSSVKSRDGRPINLREPVVWDHTQCPARSS